MCIAQKYSLWHFFACSGAQYLLHFFFPPFLSSRVHFYNCAVVRNFSSIFSWLFHVFFCSVASRTTYSKGTTVTTKEKCKMQNICVLSMLVDKHFCRCWQCLWTDLEWEGVVSLESTFWAVIVKDRKWKRVARV